MSAVAAGDPGGADHAANGSHQTTERAARRQVARWRRAAAGLWADDRRPMAASLLARACLLAPDDADLRETAARAQFEAGQLMGARASFAAMLALDPADPFALYALGLCDASLGDLDGAVRHLAAAVRADPSQRRFARALAIVRTGSDDCVQAVRGPGGPCLGGRTADASVFGARLVHGLAPSRTTEATGATGEETAVSDGERATGAWLAPADRPLVELFDVALLDLDGTVYVGHDAVPGAAASVAAARGAGMRPMFVTNNASRTPDQVVDKLRIAGVPCAAAEVLTSAQVAAQALAGRLPTGAPVLVVGGAGVRQALEAEGLRPIDSASDRPVAVAQGWSAEVGWAQLAEAAYALADPAVLWVATNLDLTLPTERGAAPGNGSLVGLLAGVVGRRPDLVVGKPEPALLESAVARGASVRPLVVGDRLDTDIAGGVRAGLPSLLVLSGVTGPHALLAAGVGERPTFVSADLTGLLVAHPEVRLVGEAWECAGWAAAVVDGRLGGGPAPSLRGAGTGGPADPVDLLKAACAAAWTATDSGVSWVLDPDLAVALPVPSARQG